MKVIITGATGMVGKGVLIECIESLKIEHILVINRTPINVKHPKLKEVLLNDFTQVETIQNDLAGYDACFFCMGISSAGMKEEKFKTFTFTIAEAFAKLLYKLNPAMVFNYVSGSGTDSSEKGRVMWARVKGKTENMILNMGFKDAYAFRPGAIIPEKGVKSKTPLYNFAYIITRPFFPLMRKSKNIVGSDVLGKAMINTLLFPQKLKHLENKDINVLGVK